MPAKIDLLLESNKELSCQMGSLFQGVIMRNLPKEEGYGDQLHIPELHAYTQHLEKDKEENWHWILTFLNKAAKEQIWDKGLKDTKSIELEQNGIAVQIKNKPSNNITMPHSSAWMYSQSAAIVIPAIK